MLLIGKTKDCHIPRYVQKKKKKGCVFLRRLTILVAIVIEGDVSLAIVRWVDVDFAIKDVSRWVGCVDVCY